jgi:hypothetical protein
VWVLRSIDCYPFHMLVPIIYADVRSYAGLHSYGSFCSTSIGIEMISYIPDLWTGMGTGVCYGPFGWHISFRFGAAPV